MFPDLPRQLLLGRILVLGLIPTFVSCSACPPPIFLPLSNCTIAGTTIDSWGLRLDLADPSQYLCVVPSTVVNSTLVISSNFCQTGAQHHHRAVRIVVRKHVQHQRRGHVLHVVVAGRGIGSQPCVG
jgi:hypothetical protein